MYVLCDCNGRMLRGGTPDTERRNPRRGEEARHSWLMLGDQAWPECGAEVLADVAEGQERRHPAEGPPVVLPFIDTLQLRISPPRANFGVIISGFYQRRTVELIGFGDRHEAGYCQDGFSIIHFLWTFLLVSGIWILLIFWRLQFYVHGCELSQSVVFWNTRGCGRKKTGFGSGSP